DNRAFDKVLEIVEKKGITVLFTGAIHLDEYWHETNRAEKLLGDVASSNVKREDLLIIEGESFPISFGGERIADTFTGVTAENNSEKQVMKWGKGKEIRRELTVELHT